MKIDDIILEAPLGSYDVVGDLSDSGSFRAPDRAIISSPKTKPRLTHAFRNTKETFDLVFVPLKGTVVNVIAAGERYGGVWTREVAHKRLPRRTLPEPSSPDAIMVVLTHNEGANRLPLSPWIIAHRIGHAVNFEPAGAKAMENIYYTIHDFVQSVSSGCADDVSNLSVVYTIGTMRSARERQLNAYAEFSYEVFTQYLMAGKVSFNRFADPLVIKGRDGDIVCQHYPADEANDFLTGMEASLDRQCARILMSLRGKVVVL